MEELGQDRQSGLTKQLKQAWRREMSFPLQLLLLLLVLVTHVVAMTIILLCRVGERIQRRWKG